MRAESLIAVVLVAQVAVMGCRTLDEAARRGLEKVDFAAMLSALDRVATEPARPVVEPDQAEPAAPEPVAVNAFRWEPRADSVRIVIPASMPHWRMGMVSPTKGVHADLRAPDKSRGRRVADGYEYIRQGDGAHWKAKSLAVDPRGKGKIAVTVHTSDRQPDGFTAAAWEVPDPERLYVVPK